MSIVHPFPIPSCFDNYCWTFPSRIFLIAQVLQMLSLIYQIFDLFSVALSFVFLPCLCYLKWSSLFYSYCTCCPLVLFPFINLLSYLILLHCVLLHPPHLFFFSYICLFCLLLFCLIMSYPFLFYLLMLNHLALQCLIESCFNCPSCLILSHLTMIIDLATLHIVFLSYPDLPCSTFSFFSQMGCLFHSFYCNFYSTVNVKSLHTPPKLQAYW